MKNRVIIVGCGRLGSSLATKLSMAGQDVVVLDASEKSFRKLPETFSASESYDLHFFAKAEDAQKYLFYLALNHPGFDLLGVYRKERETI
jgi:choline dehydrogenase-like flavoprotein